jgi:hypothetical protein
VADGLDPEVAVIRGPLIGDLIAGADAVAALRRYSLVTPAGDGLVLVHRLVQAVALGQMPDELASAWRHAAATLVDTAIPADISLAATWPACVALLPHAQVVLADSSRGMARIAGFLATAAATRPRATFGRRSLTDAIETLAPSTLTL